MKRGRRLLLSVCMLALAGISGVAQEDLSVAQEKAKAARAVAQEKRAAAKAAAEQARAAAKAYAQQKRAAQHAAAKANRVLSRMKQALSAAVKKERPDGTFKFLGSRPNIEVTTVVKGVPYSATAITEHTQTLGDGNQIIQKNEATYYRDSEGRLRIDQMLKTIGKWTADGDPPRIITIWDPVAGHYYSLDPRSRTALRNPKGPLKLKEKELQKLKAQNVAKAKQLNEAEAKQAASEKAREKTSDLAPKIKRTIGQEGSDSKRKKESLGKQVIEGVAAEGTRSTRTIPAGEIGNVRSIEIVDESWYSPELQMLVLTKHHDPRSGDTVYRLTNINRNEPDRSLFEVPADYRIVDKSGPNFPPKKIEKARLP